MHSSEPVTELCLTLLQLCFLYCNQTKNNCIPILHRILIKIALAKLWLPAAEKRKIMLMSERVSKKERRTPRVRRKPAEALLLWVEGGERGANATTLVRA